MNNVEVHNRLNKIESLIDVLSKTLKKYLKGIE